MTHHVFAWRELVTPDVPTVRGFYADLFGWSVEEQDMGQPTPYTMFHHAALDRSVGGATSPAMDGVPPHWLDYITVDDLDAALSRAAELGATPLTDAMDAEGVGRFAIVRDPVGAPFGLLQPAYDSDGEGDASPPVGTFCWSQLSTDDAEAAVAFYAALLGWTPKPLGPGMTVFFEGEQMRASVLQADGPSHWLKYVAVDDTDASWSRAQQLGATPVVEPTTMEGMGRFAVLADPAGAVFALWKDLSA